MIKDLKQKMNKKEFESSLPFKHIVIDNFLDTEFAVKLISELKKQKFDFKETDLFAFYQTKDLFKTSNPVIKEFIQVLSNELRESISNMTNKKINKIDVFGSIYKDTNYLICHDDMLENRAFAYILYLNDYSQEDGGRLRLYHCENNKPLVIAKEIMPKFNKLVVFEVSSKSFHDVSEVLTKNNRYTITGWYHYDK